MSRLFCLSQEAQHEQYVENDHSTSGLVSTACSVHPSTGGSANDSTDGDYGGGSDRGSDRGSNGSSDKAATAAPTEAATAATEAPQAAAEAAVTIDNFAFSPQSLQVKVGTTVTWTNNQGATHTVTSDTGAWDSGNLSQGKSFSFTFTKAGTFAYHCAIHSSMTGTVEVTP